MAGELPAITGRQLMRLLELDGWTKDDQRTHGVFYFKRGADGRVSTTVVPKKRPSLPPTILGRILSVKQSGLGREGLLALIEKHGLR